MIGYLICLGLIWMLYKYQFIKRSYNNPPLEIGTNIFIVLTLIGFYLVDFNCYEFFIFHYLLVWFIDNKLRKGIFKL